MTSPNWDAITTTAIENRSGILADNVSENTALLFKMKKSGTVKPFTGGRNIAQEIVYEETGNFTRYSGADVLNITQADQFTAAEFQIRQAAAAVNITGLETLQNSGKEAIIDLLEARIKNAERTLINNIGADCYSDGTADSGKQIGGLQLLVADDPTTGTVGGINRATWTFWRNQVFDATSDGSATSATTIQSNMNGMWVECVRGTDRPNLIVADNNYYKFFLASLQTIQRIADDEMATAGFTSLRFIDAPVVLDGGYAGSCPSNHMYFLNTNYIHFRPHRDRNFVPINGSRSAVNQDAIVKLIGWAGNMTLSCAFLQGVYKE